MDVRLRAHLAQLVRLAHHLVAQVVRLVQQGRARQDIVRVVHQVRVVLVQALRQVHEAQATHHRVQVLVAHEAIVVREALVVLRQ